jgi:DNA-binding NarL/FixJ family response regulator
MSGKPDIGSDAGPSIFGAKAAMIGAMPARVLVVDDDPDFRGLVVRIVAGTDGVEVREADSVATAIETALSMKPGAALVDVGLPDGNGIDLARWLSAMPWGPHIVLTSTDPDAATQDDVRACGADAFIPKDELSDVPLRRLLAIG